MLIVHLITDLSSAGAQNQLQQLVLASDKRRFRHIVASLVEGGPITSELRTAGIEVHCLGMKRGLPSLPGMVRLVRLLRRIRPDVLHCWLYHACLLGLFATRIVHVDRLIWGLRSANPGFRAYSRQARAIVRVCARLSAVPDVILVNSEIGKMVHEQWGYRTNRMRVVANGIDVQQFHPNPAARISVREELGITHDCLLVGLIGRYHPMKDHETFLRAAAMVRQQHPQVHFVLAGEGVTGENQELAQLVHENELKAVAHLLGPRRDIPRLTAALDLACLSSWSESFPNILLEAMACAVPCVATDVGDCASIVGEAGRIVPPRDPLSMAAAIGELIAMPPAERAALGRRARQRVLARFSLTGTVTAYEELYEGSAGANAAQCSRLKQDRG